MSKLTALSVSIALLGGIWAFLALGPLSGYVLVWAGFIAWGCYFNTGGDAAALNKTIAGTIYGVVLAWIALLLIVNVAVPLPAPLWPAIVVAVTVFLLVIVASVDLLSVVPAQVYGYAATVAYATLTPASELGPLQNLTTVGFANPLVLLAVSLAVGAVFGMLSGKLSAKLAA